MRLNALQAYADYRIERVTPHRNRLLDELEDRLFSGVPKGSDRRR